MKLKIEKFWDSGAKDIVKKINDSLKRMEIDPVHAYLDDLFAIIKKEKDAKIRVSLCFTLEKIAKFNPFFEEIVNFIIDLLKEERDPHVKEFAVYILGNLVLENPSLSLITETLPIFVNFCKDSSEYVSSCAEDFKNRLNEVKETKLKEKKVINALREELREYINSKIEILSQRTSKISKEALSLDYEEAYKRQDEMIEKIHEFTKLNEEAEEEIKNYIISQIDENPIYEGEFGEELDYWKDIRAEKEDLIRQVHCIIRIHTKIFKIIQFIKSKGSEKSITLEELKEQTKGGLRDQWSNEEIIETLEKLVEEEIIPNLFIQQVNDNKDLLPKDKKK